MSDWVYPRTVTADDLEWQFGKTTAEEIIHVGGQICNHARGFVVDNEIWFDQYAVMMGHRFAWGSHIEQHYPDAEKWLDVSDNALYFSLTGSGNFVIQHPIGHNLTRRHLETLYALGEKMEFPDSYEITLRNEEYDSYTNSRDTQKVTFDELYEYITADENSSRIENIIGDPDKPHGTPYRERMANRQHQTQNNTDDDDNADSDDGESDSAQQRTVNTEKIIVTDTEIEEIDGNTYALYLNGKYATGEPVEGMKWGEIVTERQAERFSDELIGTHFQGSEVKRLKNSKYTE